MISNVLLHLPLLLETMAFSLHTGMWRESGTLQIFMSWSGKSRPARSSMRRRWATTDATWMCRRERVVWQGWAWAICNCASSLNVATTNWVPGQSLSVSALARLCGRGVEASIKQLLRIHWDYYHRIQRKRLFCWCISSACVARCCCGEIRCSGNMELNGCSVQLIQSAAIGNSHAHGVGIDSLMCIVQEWNVIDSLSLVV